MTEKNTDLKTSKSNISFFENSKCSIMKENKLSLNNINQILYSQSSYNNPVSIPTNINQIMIYGNDIEKKKPSKMGKTKVFLFYNNYPLISIGPHIFYPLICIFSITSIYIFFITFLGEKSGMALIIIHHLTYFIYLICHIFSIIINPGIPSYEYSNFNKEMIFKSKINNSINLLDYHICKNCNCFIRNKDKVNHCSKCNICYMKFDHHSKWIGHCVAKNNKFFFNCFATSIWIFGLSCFGMLFVNITIKFFKIKNF